MKKGDFFKDVLNKWHDRAIKELERINKQYEENNYSINFKVFSIELLESDGILKEKFAEEIQTLENEIENLEKENQKLEEEYEKYSRLKDIVELRLDL